MSHSARAALLLALLAALLAGCAAPQTAPARPAASVSQELASAPGPRAPWLEMTQTAYELPGESAVEIGYTLHNEDGLGNEVEFPALAWRGGDGEWVAVDVRVGICGVPDPLGASQEGTLQLNDVWELPGSGEYRLTFCVLGPDGYRTTAGAAFSLILTDCSE